MKKSIYFIIAFVAVISVSAIYAADQTEVKFPGKLGLEFTTRIDADVMDNVGKKTSLSSLLTEGDLYFRNELKGKIAFQPVDFYGVTPWIADRFDFKVLYSGLVDPVTTKSILGALKPRNRFYAGVDNTFTIPKIMNIGVNFELRLGNESSQPIELRLSPILALSGKYDFGLSWAVTSFFEFYLNPQQGIHKNQPGDYTFKQFSLEINSINIQYEFLHFINVKDVKGSFVADCYILADFVTGQYRTNNLDAKKAAGDKLTNLDIYAGLNFDLWKVKPYIGFLGTFAQYYDATYSKFLLTKFRPGMKMGIGFEKDWFAMNVEYIGGILTYDNGKDAQKVLNERTQLYRYWENQISAYVKFKI
jgi:hypothetical protein